MRRIPFGLLLALTAAAAFAQAPYNADTTYRKLVRDYPDIRIASAEAPAPVQVRKDLEYARRGDLSLGLDLYLPGPGGKPAPLVILVHGGGWGTGERTNMAPLAARLAARGYAAATVSYRLSGQARYPAAIEDVQEAVRWLRKGAGSHGIDPSRVAIAGGSAGGQIAALVGMLEPQAIRAVVNIDGLSDFTSEEARRHEDDPKKNPSAAGAWFGGRYAEKEALWREASPIEHVGKNSPPVLFITSGVPRFSVGREAMAAKLATHGIHSDTVALAGTPHSFWLFDPWVSPTVDAMAAFFERVLGPVPARAPWSPDLGDGRYRNPILHADYSDPDAIRVGDTYYMVSSSFANAPGLPLLVSKDMVNWELQGHALPQLVPGAQFAAPQHGKGVWAPSLRHHDGKFWIFYPDPDNGIYVTTAKEFKGPWNTPHLLLPGKGIIDPAPLWDEDGKAYLIHAWAKSRAGFNNVLTLRKMAPDGRSLLDSEGKGGHRRRQAARLPHAGRTEAVQGERLLLRVRAGGRRRAWLAIGVPLAQHRGPLRVAHRDGAGRDKHQRTAPGRLGQDAAGQRLVLPLPGQARLWACGAPAADALERRLALDRRAVKQAGRGPAGDRTCQAACRQLRPAGAGNER